MSSIRPLATITIMAFVGVFLYLKLTEKEAELPEGVDSWAVEQNIELGGDFSFPSSTTSDSNAESFSVGSTAPSFSAEKTSSAPAFNTDTAASAPAFVPNNLSADINNNPASLEDAPEFQQTIGVPSQTAPEFSGNDAATSTTTNNNAIVTIPDLPPVPSVSATTEQVSTNPPLAAEAQDTSVPPLLTPAADAAPPVSQYTSTQQIAPPVTPTVPTATPPQNPVAQNPAQSSLFASTRLSAQAALDRGELSQALLLLSNWYGDPSLSTQETTELQTLLSQLAGSVIYSMEPRLEAPHMVQAGETLMAIGEKYDVPWQLLAKINGITDPQNLSPGRQIKVLRGPFSAIVDFSKRRMTLMLDRRYAGHFNIEIDPTVSIEEGQWTVQQKPISPANIGYGAVPGSATEERSLILTSNSGSSQLAIIRSSNVGSSLAEPANRVIRLNPQDVEDVYDILSRGSSVTIRR